MTVMMMFSQVGANIGLMTLRPPWVASHPPSHALQERGRGRWRRRRSRRRRRKRRWWWWWGKRRKRRISTMRGQEADRAGQEGHNSIHENQLYATHGLPIDPSPASLLSTTLPLVERSLCCRVCSLLYNHSFIKLGTVPTALIRNRGIRHSYTIVQIFLSHQK